MINVRGAIVLALVLMVWSAAALAQDHHPIALHERFYSNWMMPDNRTMSCCHNDDCSPAESKFENGQWLARKVGDEGPFTPVPPAKIEHDRDTPDGRSHVCGRGSGGSLAIFCFILGAGG